MASERGRTLSLSLQRRWVNDMLHAASKIPITGGQRIMKLKKINEVRRSTPHPPTWQSLIVKALAIVSMRMPELRQTYLSFPYARIYEAPYPVASIIFEREFRGEPATFMAPMLQPELRSLATIAQKVQAWKTDTIESHGVLRRLVRNAKPPLPIRRLMWWYGLNVMGLVKARLFGTYAVNTMAAIRAHVTHFACPLTSVWFYDVVNSRGEMDMRMAFDHRVFDGGCLGRAANELENVLNNDLVEEIRNTPPPMPASANPKT